MDHLDEVRNLIALTFGADTAAITGETAQDDIDGWDSVGHLNLMMALDETYDLALDIDDMARMTSVRSILQYLDSHGI